VLFSLVVPITGMLYIVFSHLWTCFMTNKRWWWWQSGRKQANVTHLLLRIDHDLALDAVLTDVGPTVTRLPLSLALRTLEFTKAALCSLIRSQTFFTRSRLQNQHINTFYGPKFAPLTRNIHFKNKECTSLLPITFTLIQYFVTATN